MLMDLKNQFDSDIFSPDEKNSRTSLPTFTRTKKINLVFSCFEKDIEHLSPTIPLEQKIIFKQYVISLLQIKIMHLYKDRTIKAQSEHFRYSVKNTVSLVKNR